MLPARMTLNKEIKKTPFNNVRISPEGDFGGLSQGDLTVSGSELPVIREVWYPYHHLWFFFFGRVLGFYVV